MVWLIGAGQMSIDYAHILQDMRREFLIIGRGETAVQKIEEEHGFLAVSGGLEDFLKTHPPLCSHAIVAVNIEHLYSCTKLLLQYGVKNILVEKPGGLYLEELQAIDSQIQSFQKVYIGYNRRFYSSTLELEKLILEDGGLSSIHFEFTERSHIVGKLKKPRAVFDNWLLANSSHVIDLSFYFAGLPEKMGAFSDGVGGLDWLSGPTRFVGSGVTENGVLFSYGANWRAPGRWKVELMTNKHRYYLCPLEKLFMQEIGSAEQTSVMLDAEMDDRFKPGLYKQTLSFLTDPSSRLSSIKNQIELVKVCNKITNGVEG